jgi:hypothetical protein
LSKINWELPPLLNQPVGAPIPSHTTDGSSHYFSNLRWELPEPTINIIAIPIINLQQFYFFFILSQLIL